MNIRDKLARPVHSPEHWAEQDKKIRRRMWKLLALFIIEVFTCFIIYAAIVLKAVNTL